MQQLPTDLADRIVKITQQEACFTYIWALLDEVSAKNGAYFSDDTLKLFNRIGKFKLKKNMKFSGEADYDGNQRVVNIKAHELAGTETDRELEHMSNAYAITVLNELMHHAKKSGVYDDRALAEAAFKLLLPDEQKANPLPTSNDYKKNSEYFHPLFNAHCSSLTGG